MTNWGIEPCTAGTYLELLVDENERRERARRRRAEQDAERRRKTRNARYIAGCIAGTVFAVVGAYALMVLMMAV